MASRAIDAVGCGYWINDASKFEGTKMSVKFTQIVDGIGMNMAAIRGLAMNIVINDNIANCYATETRPGKVDFTLGAADCDWFHDLFFPYGDSQEGIEVISGIFLLQRRAW